MRILKIVVILIAVACVPFLSHATEGMVTSSTQYLWYPDFQSQDTDQNDIAQYLRLDVTKLDKEGNINLRGYGRVIKQTSTSVEYRPEIANDTYGRLYYFFMDYRDAVKDHLNLRAGRTYVNSAAVSGTIDGAFLNFRNLGPVGITLFGGRNVLFDNKTEVGTGGDAIMGMSVYLDTIKNTHVEASYGRKYAESDLARENVGLDFSSTPHEKANIYGRVQYDTVATKYEELLFGLKLTPVEKLILRGEFFQSHPTFDKFSFYSFFAVNFYNEISIAAEYQLTNDYRVSGKYAREEFGNDADSNLYDVGLLASPIKNLTVKVSYQFRDGYAGKLNGFRFNGVYKISKAAISAGIDYDDFHRESSRDGTAKKYWAGVNYALNKTFSAAGRFEEDINYYLNHGYQGFVELNANF